MRCYYCDGGLQNWEKTDNPWVEHAKWFPNCGFLKLVKGEKFLDGSLVERFNALLNRPRSDDTTSTSQEVCMYIYIYIIYVPYFFYKNVLLNYCIYITIILFY